MMIETVRTFKSSNENEKQIDYIIYYPEKHMTINDSLPLLLFLHGAGERGRDIQQIKRHGIPNLISEGREFPFICIAPQCSEDGYWDQEPYILTLIRLIMYVKETHNIDNIVGTGLSMGGFGIIAIAVNDPSLFSAIIPICGGANQLHIKNLRNLPIWLFHGRDDDVIPVENSIAIYKEVGKINQNIKLTIYEGVSHDSWTETYKNDKVYKWLLGFCN